MWMALFFTLQRAFVYLHVIADISAMTPLFLVPRRKKFGIIRSPFPFIKPNPTITHTKHIKTKLKGMSPIQYRTHAQTAA